jgi:hypothetical protein
VIRENLRLAECPSLGQPITPCDPKSAGGVVVLPLPPFWLVMAKVRISSPYPLVTSLPFPEWRFSTPYGGLPVSKTVWYGRPSWYRRRMISIFLTSSVSPAAAAKSRAF